MTSPRPLHSYMGSSLVIEAGPMTARLANGVFGDPLLEVRLQGERRRRLFDLGEAGALSRRELNTVSDVYVTHAHLDHISGFLNLLRSRIGVPLPPCRIFGPVGTADHVAAFISGIRWDRIDDDGPVFLVGDVSADHIAWHRIQPGRPRGTTEPEEIAGGVLTDEPGAIVSCIPLDHGIPVLSYAIEVPGRHHIRTDELTAMGLEPGPWVGELLARLSAGDTGAGLTLADGTVRPVVELADRLVRESARTRLVYATDFADTVANRTALAAHAREADWLFSEATFLAEDWTLARNTNHLTTRACGEIAVQAGVKNLVPFHFSKRYIHDLDAVYAEIQAICVDLTVTRAEGR